MIFYPVRDFHIQTYKDIYDFFNDVDAVQRINNQFLCWLGHVVGMEENVSVTRVFGGELEDVDEKDNHFYVRRTKW